MMREYGGKPWIYIKTMVLTALLMTTTLAYGELELVGKMQQLDLDASKVIFNGESYFVDKDKLKITIKGTRIGPEKISGETGLDVRVIVHESKSTSSTAIPQPGQSPAVRSITAIEVIGPKDYVDNFFNH